MLTTARLRLRRVHTGDLDALACAFCDPEVMRFVAAGRALTRDEVAAMITRLDRRFEEDGFGRLAVERRSDGRVIGRVGLLPIEPGTWRFGSRT